MKNPLKRLASAAMGVAMALVLALPALAATPTVDKNKCVIDNANILSDETEQYVTNLTVALSNACGAQIGVYTISNVGNSTTENYAYQVFDAWGLGDADKNNGVLLLLVPDGDDYWMMQGQGLESRLKTNKLSQILNDSMEPNWVKGDYDSGTRQTVRAVAKELANIYNLNMDLDAVAAGNAGAIGQPADTNEGSWADVMVVVMLVIILIVAVALLSSTSRRRRGPTFFFFGGPRGPRPPRGPRGPRGPYGGGPGGFGGPPPRRNPYQPPRNGGNYGGFGGFDVGGGHTRGGGAGRSGGGFGGFSGGGGFGGGGFSAGGGGTRGGGAGRH